LMATARGVIVDCRGRDYGPRDDAASVAYYLDEYVDAIAPMLVDVAVTTGSWRYRMHNGFAPMVGASSGGYYSGIVTRIPETIVGRGTSAIPIVMILDNRSPAGAEVACGLRAARRAFIVHEGAINGDNSTLQQRALLADSIEVLLRIADLMSPDGSLGLTIDSTVPRTADDRAMTTARGMIVRGRPGAGGAHGAPTGLVASVDSVYADMKFPSLGYRLLALFRYWNVINYFAPYRDLADEPWETMLERYIPRFEANRSAADYQQTIRELVAEIDDSHGWVSGGDSLADRRGRYLPPVVLRFVAGESMITHVLDSSADARVGDVVVAIDGVPIVDVRRQIASLWSASTPQSLERNVHYDLGRGEEGASVRMTLRGLDGTTRDVSLVRTIRGGDPRLAATSPTIRSTPVFGVLPSGFGYVDLERLERSQVDSMFDAIAGTPATIFDMRGYPRQTAWAIAPNLSTKTSQPVALFSRPYREAIALDGSDASRPTYGFSQTFPPPHRDIYTGRVVMLINEYAQSQSEHTALAFEAMTDVTFIGTPTAGANGDVTRVTLPGGITASFSGHSVRHADGRQLQRVGIQPHVRVEPTVRGIAEGRDEVLEAAVEYLRQRR
jgi:hypothetical protein